MKIVCHIDMVDQHIELTLMADGQLIGADRQTIPIHYEAISICNHISEIGSAFTRAYVELTRQVAQKNL